MVVFTPNNTNPYPYPIPQTPKKGDLTSFAKGYAYPLLVSFFLPTPEKIRDTKCKGYLHFAKGYAYPLLVSLLSTNTRKNKGYKVQGIPAFCEGIKKSRVPSKRVFFLTRKKRYLPLFQEGIR